jgi:hypothetical protein
VVAVGGRGGREEWLGVADEGRFPGTFVGCVKFGLRESVGPKFVYVLIVSYRISRLLKSSRSPSTQDERRGIDITDGFPIMLRCIVNPFSCARNSFVGGRYDAGQKRVGEA